MNHISFSWGQFKYKSILKWLILVQKRSIFLNLATKRQFNNAKSKIFEREGGLKAGLPTLS